MLTSKQIKELPKGTHRNSDIAAVFPHHGKKSRTITLPVDQHGKVVSNLMDFLKTGKTYSMVPMRLGRREAKAYKKG